MTKLDKLRHRAKKIREFYKTLPPLNGDKNRIAYKVVAEEYDKTMAELTKEKLEEFIDMDSSFEQEVLKDDE